MIRFNFLKTLILLAALGMGQAQASLLLEPYLGYRVMGDGENSGPGVTNEYSYNSAVLGGRVGYQFLGLMAGLDFSISKFDFEIETSGMGVTMTGKDEYQGRTIGAFVGYNLPILFRVWAAYFFDAKYENQSGPDKGDNFTGSGYALGVGFTGLPFVSLNLEYRSLTFDQFEAILPARTVTNLTGDSELNSNEIILSVSLPLTF